MAQNWTTAAVWQNAHSVPGSRVQPDSPHCPHPGGRGLGLTLLFRGSGSLVPTFPLGVVPLAGAPAEQGLEEARAACLQTLTRGSRHSDSGPTVPPGGQRHLRTRLPQGRAAGSSVGHRAYTASVTTPERDRGM